MLEEELSLEVGKVLRLSWVLEIWLRVLLLGCQLLVFWNFGLKLENWEVWKAMRLG